MTEPPKDLQSLTARIIASQSQRITKSLSEAKLTPQQKKEIHQEERISKMPWGPAIPFHQREAEIRTIKAVASRETQRTQTVKGQATLVGQPPKGPDR